MIKFIKLLHPYTISQEKKSTIYDAFSCRDIVSMKVLFALLV